MPFETPNPDYRRLILDEIAQAPFVRALGMTIVDLGPGWVESEMLLRDDFHLQQDGYVHAGVQATLADHTAGAAAGTLAPADRQTLTVEFKLNLLRPAQGDRLTCRADVLKAGRTLTVAEASVYCRRGNAQPQLVSKATVTLIYVAATDR